MILFGTTVFADAPPDFGYSFVSVDLILETQEDFSDFDFFLVSQSESTEILLKIGETVTISSAGRRVGPGHAATLYAVPKNAFNEDAQNRITVLRHSFRQTIPYYEKLTWENPKYRVERDGTNNIKAVKIGGTNISIVGWFGLVFGVLFLSLAVLVLGVWLFRKKLRKS